MSLKSHGHRPAIVALVLGGVVTLAVGSVRAPGQFDTGPGEAAAIGALRAINSAQSTYASSCGASGYSQSLEALAAPPRGGTVGFISPGLAERAPIAGYVITLKPDAAAVAVATGAQTCNGREAVSSYFASAVSVAGPRTRRSFATDATGRVYFRLDGAVIEPGMAGATVLQ